MPLTLLSHGGAVFGAKYEYEIESVAVSTPEDTQKISSGSDEIMSVPALMGEYDVVKYITTLPGIITTSILDPNFYVRGGAGYENQYLVSSFPVASPQHLTGVMSLFSPFIFDTSTLYRSGYPARYSGVASSFLDMSPQQRLESEKSWEGELSLGLISSSLNNRVKIGERGGVLSIAARYSYLEPIFNLANKLSPEVDQVPYSFGDITASYNNKLSDKWSLQLFGLYSKDNLSINGTPGMDIEWSRYAYNATAKRQSAKSTLTIAAGAWNAKTSGDSFVSYQEGLSMCETNLRVETFYKYWIAANTNVSSGANLKSTLYSIYDSRLYTYSWYGQAYHKFPIGLSVEGGVNIEGYVTDKSQISALPRAKIEYRKGSWSIWGDYSRTAQYNVTITTLAIPSPADITIPLTEGSDPTLCDQSSLGVKKSFRPSNISLSASLFYRKYNDAKEAVSFSLSQGYLDASSTSIASGTGAAQGAELEFEIKRSWFNARANYTYSDSWREFDQINLGERFHPPYDITHSVFAMVEFKIAKRFRISTMWSYASGTYITFPIGVTITNIPTLDAPTLIPIYDNIYNYRLPATHRLDINLEYTTRKLALNVGVYNLYNQPNISFIDYKVESYDKYYSVITPVGHNILPILPYFSITYRW